MNPPLRKCRVLLVTAAVVVVYFSLAFSPVADYVGRRNPSLASWLSPPIFNFHGTYDSGKVLGIEVGMPRDEFRRSLKHLFSSDMLTPCGTWNGPPQVVPITGPTWTAGRRAPLEVESADELFVTATASEEVCVQSISHPQLLIVSFASDKVVRVEANYLRGPR